MDLDIPLERMKDNKEALFSDDPASVFGDTKDYKKAFVARMLNEDLTFDAVAGVCPEFGKLLTTVGDLVAVLPLECESVIYYSGGCGIRVLFWAKEGWRRVQWLDNTYAQEAVRVLLPELLKKQLHVPDDLFAKLMPHMDKNIYDVDKGTKPDVLAHPDTKVYPVPWSDDFLAQRLRTTPHPELSAAITRFWRTLFFERVPENVASIPRLTGERAPRRATGRRAAVLPGPTATQQQQAPCPSFLSPPAPPLLSIPLIIST